MGSTVVAIFAGLAGSVASGWRSKRSVPAWIGLALGLAAGTFWVLTMLSILRTT